MTSRHTITHADEIYVGNAFKAGYSPDGRRGIKMTHLYAHEFLSTAAAVPIAGDPDGFLCGIPSDLGFSASGGDIISLCSGALIATTGATVITLDVPRNIRFSSCNAASTIMLKIHGKDQYGEAMAETILGKTGGTVACGVRCFKSIDKMYTTAAFSSIVIIGTGNRLGLPFHLPDKGKIVSVSVDGGKVSTADATAAYVVHTGLSLTTTLTTTGGDPDCRGSIDFLSPAPNAALRFTALMVVDHTTSAKAFGLANVSSCSNG